MAEERAPSQLLSRHADEDLVAFGHGETGEHSEGLTTFGRARTTFGRANAGRANAGDRTTFGRANAPHSRTAADLRRDAAIVAASLPPATDESAVLLVFRHDRYQFAVALLAAWAKGHRVALPPNTRRETVWEARDASEAVAILHDTESGTPHRIDDLLAAADARTSPITSIPPSAARAIVFTSGSTGRMSACVKGPAQLLGEAAMQADVHGFAPGTRVVATVAPGHIYGLLFSVLAPLVSGAAFHREAPLHAETVAESVRDSGADVLVVVPAHVRALAALPEGRLGGRVRLVLSSTAPLDAGDAQAFADAHAVPVTEIFGSSETGGIAWRRAADDHRWSPLPEVETSADAEGRLVVRSPWSDGAAPTTTGDLVRVHDDGRFEHLGRVDGVVKVGGRRVSLRAVERALLRLNGVDDAAVVAVPEPTGRGQQLLAAVVADEHEWTVTRLREALAERFERSTLPRRVLHARSLPREDTGKIQRSRLLGMFGLDASGAPIPWDLEWGPDERTHVGDAVEHRFEAHVPDNYGWYEGHFPGYPILAGAVQLRDLALRCIRRARPELGAVAGVSRLKFLGRIQPGDDIVVTLRWVPGERNVDMAITRGDTQCSAGRVAFVDGGHAAGASA